MKTDDQKRTAGEIRQKLLDAIREITPDMVDGQRPNETTEAYKDRRSKAWERGAQIKVVADLLSAAEGATLLGAYRAADEGTDE